MVKNFEIISYHISSMKRRVQYHTESIFSYTCRAGKKAIAIITKGAENYDWISQICTKPILCQHFLRENETKINKKQSADVSKRERLNNTVGSIMSMGKGIRKTFVNHMYGKEGSPIDHFQNFYLTFIKWWMKT